jgi:hypothetical protein
VRLACALASAASGIAARAQDLQLDVGVRTKVVDRDFGKSDLKSAPAHGKVYAIVAVQEVKGEGRLVKAVNEAMIMQVLSQELNANGFRLFTPGERPEILLMVHYGRGFLANPYQVDGGRTETPGGATSASGAGSSGTGGPTIALTGVPTQLFKQLSPGHEAKLQKARYEKLYIRVTAWSYPTDSKAHNKQLWSATMLVDDPEHRDLNAIAEKMLAAGAPYFGRELKEEEVDVFQPLPEGHVKVGTPEVVESKK